MKLQQKVKSYHKVITLLIILMLTIPVTVPILATPIVSAATVKLSTDSLTLILGQSKTLKLIGTTKKILWSSSDNSIASVSKQGKVTGVSIGTAAITAKIGKKKYVCKVAVKPFESIDYTYETLNFSIPTDVIISSSGSLGFFQFVTSNGSSITIKDVATEKKYTDDEFETYAKSIVTDESQAKIISNALEVDVCIENFSQTPASLSFGNGIYTNFITTYEDKTIYSNYIYDIYANGHMYEIALANAYNNNTEDSFMLEAFSYLLYTVTIEKSQPLTE